MKTTKLLAAASIALACSPALADGHADAGKEVFEESCERCHYSDDYAHEAESVVVAMIKAIRSGETRHRPPLKDLTDEEIASLAAFLANQ
ncbi:MAG: hypothetical protein QNI96_13640 [Woeseiaceae bacterium]|nr:hypothetical protein [Woeseiaceae bacterium]